MKCPGFVALSEGVREADGEDDTYSKPGAIAHAVAAQLLIRGGDAWPLVGQQIEGGVVDQDTANAVQVYLEAIRRVFPSMNTGASLGVEYQFHAPTIHSLCYGTADFWFIAPQGILHVWDYKHGIGVIVEVEENPQLMYYACGVLETQKLWGAVETVVLHIVQPRAPHYAGPVRSWTISVADLKAWRDHILVPAMNRAMVSRDTASGEHCRFCPALRRACPQLVKDMEEMEELMDDLKKSGAAEHWTNGQLGRFLDLFDVAKMVNKAQGQIGYQRLQAGQTIPGRKLAKSKVNREWKEGAEPALVGVYGQGAMTKPELKSPAGIEALPGGADQTARWAFKPDAGLVMVKDTDTRAAVSRDTKSMFEAATKKRKGG